MKLNLVLSHTNRYKNIIDICKANKNSNEETIFVIFLKRV